MTSIAVLASTPLERLEMTRLLRPLGVVHVYERTDALRAALGVERFDLVVCELRDRRGERVAPLLRELASRDDRPAVVIRMTLDAASAREVVSLVQSRVDARVALRRLDDLVAIARAALADRPEPRAGPVIIERVGTSIPAGLEAFVLLAAMRATARLRVGRVAAYLGVAPRTLESRLHKAGWPSAHTVLGWCTALHAVWRLDVRGERVKQVMAALELGSPSALANLLNRYCGCTPRTVREHGGFPEMVERFARTVGASHRV